MRDSGAEKRVQGCAETGEQACLQECAASGGGARLPGDSPRAAARGVREGAPPGGEAGLQTGAS